MKKTKKTNVKIVAIRQVVRKGGKSRHDFQEEIAHLEKKKLFETLNKNREEQIDIAEKQKKGTRLEEELRNVPAPPPKEPEIEQRKEEQNKAPRLYAAGNDVKNDYRILPKNANETYSSDSMQDQKTYTTDTQVRREEYRRPHEKEESPHRKYKTRQ